MKLRFAERQRRYRTLCVGILVRGLATDLRRLGRRDYGAAQDLRTTAYEVLDRALDGLNPEHRLRQGIAGVPTAREPDTFQIAREEAAQIASSRLSGEWFEPSAELLAHISALKTGAK